MSRICRECKRDGLEVVGMGHYEDTIIVYCSDHGGVMPRSKRFLYSSGTHCPLVVRIPENWQHLSDAPPGSRVQYGR